MTTGQKTLVVLAWLNVYFYLLVMVVVCAAAKFGWLDVDTALTYTWASFVPALVCAYAIDRVSV